MPEVHLRNSAIAVLLQAKEGAAMSSPVSAVAAEELVLESAPVRTPSVEAVYG